MKIQAAFFMITALVMAVPSPAISADKDVVVTNTPANAVPIQGGVTVENTVPISGDVRIQNVPDVRIANTADVQITNTLANPVPVENILAEDREVFQVHVFGTMSDTVPTQSEFVELPVGKRFVMEYISIRIDTLMDQDYRAFVEVLTFDPEFIEHFFPAEFQGPHVTSKGLRHLHFISQKATMYANWNSTGGSDITLLIRRWPASGEADYVIAMSGFLVDIP
jgi:hypothetical protein